MHFFLVIIFRPSKKTCKCQRPRCIGTMNSGCFKKLRACHFRAAAMTLRTVLLSLQALLAAAEPDDPQDAVVANQVGVYLCFHFFSCLNMMHLY